MVAFDLAWHWYLLILVHRTLGTDALLSLLYPATSLIFWVSNANFRTALWLVSSFSIVNFLLDVAQLSIVKNAVLILISSQNGQNGGNWENCVPFDGGPFSAWNPIIKEHPDGSNNYR